MCVYNCFLCLFYTNIHKNKDIYYISIYWLFSMWVINIQSIIHSVLTYVIFSMFSSDNIVQTIVKLIKYIWEYFPLLRCVLSNSRHTGILSAASDPVFGRPVCVQKSRSANMLQLVLQVWRPAWLWRLFWWATMQ